jgi:hypothetical protein
MQIIKCNCFICNKSLSTELFADHTRNPIGFGWVPRSRGYSSKLVELPLEKTDRFICSACLSGFQSMKERCGAGFECSGGVDCTSSHK